MENLISDVPAVVLYGMAEAAVQLAQGFPIKIEKRG
jgi:hypothetical protein